MSTLFLISPARCSGERAGSLVTSMTSAMAQRLRGPGAPLGDVFAWLSALYFRGKLTYAQRFAPDPVTGVRVMAPGLGLRDPNSVIFADDLQAMGTVEVESDAFIGPLRRDAEKVATNRRVVLLGSIATGKYITTLLDVFGERLVFPASFVGRGDMSRGGLLLRAARSGEELDYVPVAGATLKGKRPPKLPALQRAATTIDSSADRNAAGIGVGVRVVRSTKT